MTDPEAPDEFAELAAMLARAQADADRERPDPHDPGVVAARRRRQRRRRIGAAITAFVILAAVGTYVPVTLLAPATAATVTVSTPRVAQPAAVAVVLPGIGASAVSVTGAEDFEGTVGTDGILASSGGNAPRPIASITKLVTALVVLEAKPLGAKDAGPTIRFSKANADLYDRYYVMNATVQPMKTGSTLSERSALEMMLVVSATNYADAVSTWAFGSAAGFRSATKAWLAAKGLTGTTIVEPTGIDARNTSTPSDLIAIGKLALANPTLAEIVRKPNLDVPGFNALPNTNELLGIDGVTGIKTGTLEEAGACLLFSATLHVGTPSPVVLVGVVLGGSDHGSVNVAVQELIASITAGFHDTQLTVVEKKLGSYTTPWGDHADIVTDSWATVLTWSDAPITAAVTTKRVATAADGAGVGELVFTAGKSTVTVPLVLKGAITGPDAWWRLTHPAELLGW